MSIYRELVEAEPKLPEDDGQVVDSIEQAHYVTLGLAYEQSGRLSGSSFEPILKKCDGFQDDPLADTLPLREERAAKVLEADKAVKEIAAALKETGAWHQFIGQQIIVVREPAEARAQTGVVRRDVREDAGEARGAEGEAGEGARRERRLDPTRCR